MNPYVNFYINRSIKVICDLLVNNMIAIITVIVPTFCIIIILACLISFTDFINKISIEISQVSYPQSESMKNYNQLGRYAVSIVVLGIILIFKSFSLLRPDIAPEFKDSKNFIF